MAYAIPSPSFVALERPAHLSVPLCANRSAARAGTRAFRGINGRLPTLALLTRAPSFYSTVPLRPRCIAVLRFAHKGTDKCAGRSSATNEGYGIA